MDGFRKSMSISSTRLPSSASAVASMTAIVLLPSLGVAEVMASVLTGLPPETNCRFMDSVLMPSRVSRETAKYSGLRFPFWDRNFVSSF